MDKTILITYDLNKPGQHYQKLFDTLTGWGAKRGLLSVWFLKGNYGISKIHDVLWNLMDANDRLFVCEVGDFAARNLMIKLNQDL